MTSLTGFQLKQQLASNGDPTKAAELLYQLDQLRLHYGLQGIDVIDNEVEWIVKAREELLKKADGLLVTGSSTQNQADTGIFFFLTSPLMLLVAKACQIFYHLHCLEDVVVDRISDNRLKLRQIISDSLQTLSANLSNISTPTNLSGSTTRAKQSSGSGATSPNLGRATHVPEEPKVGFSVWKHLEALFQVLYQKVLQVVHLQSVLRQIVCPDNTEKQLWDVIEVETFKRIRAVDSQQHQQQHQKSEFRKPNSEIEDDEDLILLVWDSLCSHLSQQFKAALSAQSKSQSVLQNLLAEEYPRVLRIIYDFLKKLEVHTDLRPEPGRVSRRQGIPVLREQKLSAQGWPGSEDKFADDELEHAHYNFFKDEVQRQKLINAFEGKSFFLTRVCLFHTMKLHENENQAMN